MRGRSPPPGFAALQAGIAVAQGAAGEKQRVTTEACDLGTGEVWRSACASSRTRRCASSTAH